MILSSWIDFAGLREPQNRNGEQPQEKSEPPRGASAWLLPTVSPSFDVQTALRNKSKEGMDGVSECKILSTRHTLNDRSGSNHFM